MLCGGDRECDSKSGMFAALTMASILLLATVPRNLYCRMKFIAGDSGDFYFSPAKLIKQIKFTECEAVCSVHYYVKLTGFIFSFIIVDLRVSY